MKNMLFLGVDTSNYTTSLSLVSENQIIANVRRLLPVKDGQRGLRQSDALFLHTKALPELAEELFSVSGYSKNNVCAVGVSDKPRDAELSYMPCFLAGVSFATAISQALQIPLYTFSHQAGHIRAAIYSCGNFTPAENEEFISFHISGGTTEALITKKNSHSYVAKIVGGTNDASAGQIIDRAGVMMGLSFPCGKELDAISSGSKKILTPSVSVNGSYFSMSGLENKVLSFLKNKENNSDIALFVFSSIAKALEKSLIAIRKQYGNLPCVFAGGVMSNSVIRSTLSRLENVYFADIPLSSDNACGTALLTMDKFLTYSCNRKQGEIL